MWGASFCYLSADQFSYGFKAKAVRSSQEKMLNSKEVELLLKKNLHPQNFPAIQKLSS